MDLANRTIKVLLVIIKLLTLLIDSFALPLNQLDEYGVQDILEYGSRDPIESEFSPRTFMLDESRLWLWPMGIVPYEIDEKFSENQKSLILKAMEMFSEVSCVRWVPWTDEEARVKILHSSDRKCVCQIGRIRPFSELTLGDICFKPEEGYVGAVEHEMMHAMGFIHEHQRFDRNCYIRLDVSNESKQIEPQNIDVIGPWEADHSFPYDINSIMHYRNRGIKDLNGEPLNNHTGVLTESDMMKINYLYCGGPSYCQLRPDDCKPYVYSCDP